MGDKPKIIRITTIPDSLKILLKGQMRFMSQNGFDVVMVSAAGDCIQELEEQEGLPHVIMPLTRKITPFKDLYALIKMYLFFLRTKPQIVHSHTPKAGTIGMIAAKLARVPHRLHTIAGLPLLEATGGKRKLLNFVEKLTYSCATKIYPNSGLMMDIVIKEGFCKPNKLQVIGNGSSNGINTSDFDPSLYPDTDKELLRTELGMTKDDLVFIFVGRLVGDKGINELVRAFDQISAEAKKIKLLLVGSLETQLDPLLPETLASMGSNKNIVNVGFKKDVRPYFAIADALVFPSYREGFPNVVMQAGAMGLPSIVSNINGCNEIIIEGRNGIIVPVKNSEALYEAMKQIMDKEMRDHLSAQARTLIVSRYDQKVVWQSLLEEYKKKSEHV